MKNNNKQENLQFKIDVAPGVSGVLSERVKSPGTVEKLTVRFYKGQESSLKIRPIIMKKGNRPVELVTYVGTEMDMSGEDDVFTFDISIAVENDDEIQVIYHNQDATYTYKVLVYVTIDYYGGTNRVVS